MGSLTRPELIEGSPPWNRYAITRVVVSNVAGHVLREQLLRSFQHAVVEWFDPETKKAKIKNHYRNPAQLGSDRFAAAIGAHALFPSQALLIATCGTALTMDAVTADGDFIGGMIAPGLKLMAQALAENTAQLPALSEHVATSENFVAHFANHTDAAIVSGCLAAQAGAIELAVREFAATKKAEPLCIISGGAAKYIMPSLRISHQFIDNLVLIGLQAIS
jgi:type III pantothenate kinase